MLAVVISLLWFAGSIANNTMTKSVMAEFPFPLTVAYVGLLFQLAAGIIEKRHSSGSRDENGSTPAAPRWLSMLISATTLLHFVFHRVALKHGSVPFTHTAKSSGTIFVAFLSASWLKEPLGWSSCASIALLIAGIVLATCTELQFSLTGFIAAIIAAASQSVQVVGTKKLLRSGLSKADIYTESMAQAALMFLPIWLYTEAPRISAMAASSTQTLVSVMLSGACLYWQEMCGLWLLTLVGPVSHALSNGMRSLVVIVAGAWYFRTAMGIWNITGIMVALMGVTLHGMSATKQAAPRPKKE